jgi:predicted alpha-1,2-mannosidase
MRPGAYGLIAIALTAALAPASPARALPSSLVDPFVGTGSAQPDIRHGGGAGATLPGAAVPFGMVQLSPETVPALDAFGAGYAWSDRRIRGFSPTHVSGTGCAVLGDVPLLPVAAALRRPPSAAAAPRFDHAHEAASPGRYRVVLDPGTPRAIDVRAAATARTGVLRIRFPRGRPATVLIDAGGSQTGDDAAGVRIDPRRGEVVATARGGRFCGSDDRHRVVVVARFSAGPRAWGTWQGARERPGTRTAHEERAATGGRPVPGGLPVAPVRGARAGAYLRFAPGSTVEVRLGVSFVDAAGARRNLAAETPAGARRGTALGPIERAARRAWDRILGRVRVDGGTGAQRATMATALYHALLHPNVVGDVDGRYPGLDGRVHRARGWAPRTTIAGWDAYRTQFPLLAMLFPEHARDTVRSLVAGASEQGCLPRWTIGGDDARVMVGEPGAVMLAAARALAVGGTTASAAAAAALRSVSPPCRTGADLAAGAGAVVLERAVADFATSRLAAAAGDPATAVALRERSSAWRALDLAHAPDPASGAGLVEGSAEQYLWAPAFDLPGLTAVLGGPDAAADRLQRFVGHLSAGPSSPFAALGNEPSFGAPWLLDAFGRPAATQATVRRALALVHGGPAGLPGNDDAGALSAWWVLGALGLYPAVPGTDLLAVGSPLFPHAELRPGGATDTIVIDGPTAAAGRPYVAALRLDGRPVERPWVRFAELRRGARLAFTLAARATRWGAGAPAPPPPPVDR